MTAADTLALLDWKRRVFALYAAVRSMEPESGLVTPVRMRTSVDFPAPLSPMIARISPLRMSISTPSTAVMVPYDFANERPRRLTLQEKEWLGVYLEQAA